MDVSFNYIMEKAKHKTPGKSDPYSWSYIQKGQFPFLYGVKFHMWLRKGMEQSRIRRHQNGRNKKWNQNAAVHVNNLT